MTTWSSASAMVARLRAGWELPHSAATWSTIAVQLGFVCGALVSSIPNLSDVVSPGRVIPGRATGAAGINELLLAAGGAALYF